MEWLLHGTPPLFCCTLPRGRCILLGSATTPREHQWRQEYLPCQHKRRFRRLLVFIWFMTVSLFLLKAGSVPSRNSCSSGPVESSDRHKTVVEQRRGTTRLIAGTISHQETVYLPDPAQDTRGRRCYGAEVLLWEGPWDMNGARACADAQDAREPQCGSASEEWEPSMGRSAKPSAQSTI